MSDSLIQFPAMERGASFAGTCLMQTMMFTELVLVAKILPKTPRSKNEGGAPMLSINGTHYEDHDAAQLVTGPAFENQRGVCAAEAEGIRERVLDGSPSGDVWHVVQVALGIGGFQIDCGRQNLVA